VPGIRAPLKAVSAALILLLVISTARLSMACLNPQQPYPGTYHYRFVVDEDGFTRVKIRYESLAGEGASWVFIPKFTPWINRTLSGCITGWRIIDTEELTGEEYYFYRILAFTFKSEGEFSFEIEFNMTVGAVIIEPRGIFFSPQIGFRSGEFGEAEVRLPQAFGVVKAIAIGQRATFRPSKIGDHYVLFSLLDNMVRLQVEFRTEAAGPELVRLKRGLFTFETPTRYRRYAQDILELLATTYDQYVDLFNVTLNEVEVEFFIPDFETLLSIGGYVPFTGRRLGDIRINVFYVRTIRGTLEIVALHELVHHFLWRAGISPSKLLWFHEGMAQYVSIEIADEMGYEGASWERERLLNEASILLNRYGGDLSFLQYWRPGYTPTDISMCYAAAYYIVSSLAETYGGLDYYRRFFRLIRGREVADNDHLIYYLGVAANTSLVQTFRGWGFQVTEYEEEPAQVPPVILEAERAVSELNPLLQPYKFLAEYLCRIAYIDFKLNLVDNAILYAEAAIWLARNACPLTIATWSAILLAVLYLILRGRRGRAWAEGVEVEDAYGLGTREPPSQA